MASDNSGVPASNTAHDRDEQADIPTTILLAQASGESGSAGEDGGNAAGGTAGGNAAAPSLGPVIPGVPNGEVHVDIPPGETVVRVQAAPGETIDLPFAGDMAARIGQQGNLAIKVGDETIILLGYAEANQEAGVTLHDAAGKPIDIAAVIAQTDPNLDIQTAAGPAAGPAGTAGGHLFFGFNPGDGLGGFGELGLISPTALQYGLIQPDEFIRPFRLDDGLNDHTLAVSSTDGSASSETTNLSLRNDPSGSQTVGDYLLNTSVEGQPISPALVNGVDPNNLHLNFASDVNVTFERGAAKFHSIVGVYTYDANGHVDGVKFVWLDSTQANPDVLHSPLVTDFLGNSQPQTVNIGSIAAGQNIGFFLLQDGANNATDVAIIKAAIGGGGNGYDADMAALNAKTTITFDSNGVGHIFVDGQELSGTVIFTESSHNPNDDKQAISGVSTPADGLLYVGFEDRGINSGADKDYNDVVFGVDLGKENISQFDQQIFSPHIQLSDNANDITAFTIDTTGFLVGDLLSNLKSADGFDVTVNHVGNDYQVTVTETTDHSSGEWQNFINNISFTTSSQTEGERDIKYTVTDSAGHAATTTASVEVTTQHTESLSTETEAKHPGTALLHDGGNPGHDVTWGSGDDTLYLDQHFAATDGKLDMGAGDNTLAVGVNGIGITNADTSHLENLNHIDMTGYNGGGGNATTLSFQDVISATGSEHELTITGDSVDSVNLAGDGNATDAHWHKAGSVNSGGVTYDQYDWHSGAGNGAGSIVTTVLINHDVHQNVTDLG
ncbi:MAG TPA: DUF4114 domain-containing protein [Terriglobia bacterium]|nr:DUF4114 domain-containing protein [Terriglobia bacterium]